MEIKAVRVQSIGVEAWARQAKDGGLVGRAVVASARLISEKRATDELAKGCAQ